MTVQKIGGETPAAQGKFLNLNCLFRQLSRQKRKYNFDIDGLNFGSTYTALELSMLGHMASGSAETPRDASISSRGGVFGAPGMFGNGANPALYDGSLGDCSGIDQSTNGIFNNNGGYDQEKNW